MELTNIILLTPEEEQKIRNKSPDKMPLNPTAQGWSGQEVRRWLAKGVFDTTDSVLSVFKQKMSAIKDLIDMEIETNGQPISMTSAFYLFNSYEEADADPDLIDGTVALISKGGGKAVFVQRVNGAFTGGAEIDVTIAPDLTNYWNKFEVMSYVNSNLQQTVHIGDTPPTQEKAVLWIDTSEEE